MGREMEHTRRQPGIVDMNTHLQILHSQSTYANVQPRGTSVPTRETTTSKDRRRGWGARAPCIIDELSPSSGERRRLGSRGERRTGIATMPGDTAMEREEASPR